MTSIRADKKQSVKADKSSLMYKRVPLERVVYGVVFALFSLYVVSLVFPFVWIFVNSLKTNLQFQDDIDHQKLFALPVAWLFKNYIYAFSQMKDGNGVTFLSMAVNSVWYMLVSAGIGVFASAMTGYVMSKFRFRGRGVVYSVIIFSMTVPIVGTLGAAFRLWSNIGLYDTPLFPVVSHLGGLGFNFLVMYGFFKNISSSYAEAVYVDGGGEYTVLFRIMLPVALPPMSALFIMACIGAWNDYMTVILYLPSYPTIASGLYEIQYLFERDARLPLYFAALIISIIPVLTLFALFSGKIMKNMTVGGLKG